MEGVVHEGGGFGLGERGVDREAAWSSRSVYGFYSVLAPSVISARPVMPA